MQMCMGSFLVVFLADRMGLSLGAGGPPRSTRVISGSCRRILWGIAAVQRISPRKMLGGLGATMALAAFVTASMTASWPFVVVLVVSFVYGASAIGWNGVYLAEVVRMAPPGKAGSATGASLA